MLSTSVRQYEVSDADASVWGRVMVGILPAIEQDAALAVLNTYHLSTIDPDSWYPLQVWMRVLRDVAAQQCDLVSLGRKMMAAAPLPRSLTRRPLPDVLRDLDGYYQRCHQGQAGGLEVRQVAARYVTVGVNVPYPDGLVYGGLWQLCHRCLPSATPFNITDDPHHLPRQHGGQRTVLHVRWAA